MYLLIIVLISTIIYSIFCLSILVSITLYNFILIYLLSEKNTEMIYYYFIVAMTKIITSFRVYFTITLQLDVHTHLIKMQKPF